MPWLFYGLNRGYRIVKNPDIAANLGRLKKPEQTLIGFALETTNAEANAQDKLERKKLDFIVLNSLRDPGAGFGTDTNKITIFAADNKVQHFELKSKKAVARDIINVLADHLQEQALHSTGQQES